MNSTMELFTTEYRGGIVGSKFVDAPPSGDLSNSTISKIVIRHGCFVDALEIYYSWNNGKSVTHGGSGGMRSEIILTAGEFITRIEGRSTDAVIVQLTFVTTKRRCGPYGGAIEGQYFAWGTADGELPRLATCMRLLAFNGSSSDFLRGLRATFAQYRNNPKTARYEIMSPLATPATGSSGATGVPISRGKFSCRLMRPIVTLSIGHEKVQFYAHEDTLCQLPFFQAALRGQFKEASKKAIDMPEDDPSKVSALIEFLYTGNYTYTYDPSSAHVPAWSCIPAGDLDEGLYHVGVYVVAFKYDCLGLSKMAVENFKAVTNELDNINTLRLWKAAYSEGLQISRRGEDFDMYRSGEGLIAWVKGLFNEDCEEMEEMMAACPELACDLLRIASGA